MTIRLSAISRLGLTFDRELSLDSDRTIFTEERYNKYVAMRSEALRRQESTLKSIVLVDFLLLLMMNGTAIKIPGLDLNMAEIPAALESLLLMSSVSFFFLSMIFVNGQSYECIIDTWNVARSRPKGVDPELVSSSDTYKELGLKIFRMKMNIWGIDFFTPGRMFAFFSRVIQVSVLVVILSVILIHLLLCAAAVYDIFARYGWTFWVALVTSSSVLCNCLGILIFAVFIQTFSFSEARPTNEPDAIE